MILKESISPENGRGLWGPRRRTVLPVLEKTEERRCLHRDRLPFRFWGHFQTRRVCLEWTGFQRVSGRKRIRWA